ncbi:MAG TPA: hypothetical protein VIE64_07280 [Solirubrobacterales bacterium]
MDAAPFPIDEGADETFAELGENLGRGRAAGRTQKRRQKPPLPAAATRAAIVRARPFRLRFSSGLSDKG